MGPEDATLLVKTFRQGVAAKVGHDLTIEVTKWEATYGEDGSLELTADPSSFVVRGGINGLKPLTDKDRAEILENITSKVLGTSPIVFRSTGAHVGTLELAGKTQPVGFSFATRPDGTFTAEAVVRQSDWGIKPFTAMLGALKVRDEVEIAAEGKLPG